MTETILLVLASFSVGAFVGYWGALRWLEWRAVVESLPHDDGHGLDGGHIEGRLDAEEVAELDRELEREQDERRP